MAEIKAQLTTALYLVWLVWLTGVILLIHLVHGKSVLGLGRPYSRHGLQRSSRLCSPGVTQLISPPPPPSLPPSFFVSAHMHMYTHIYGWLVMGNQHPNEYLKFRMVIKYREEGLGELSPWAPATKPADLSSISRTQMMEGRNWLLRVVLWSTACTPHQSCFKFKVLWRKNMVRRASRVSKREGLF